MTVFDMNHMGSHPGCHMKAFMHVHSMGRLRPHVLRRCPLLGAKKKWIYQTALDFIWPPTEIAQSPINVRITSDWSLFGASNVFYVDKKQIFIKFDHSEESKFLIKKDKVEINKIKNKKHIKAKWYNYTFRMISQKLYIYKVKKRKKNEYKCLFPICFYNLPAKYNHLLNIFSIHVLSEDMMFCALGLKTQMQSFLPPCVYSCVTLSCPCDAE